MKKWERFESDIKQHSEIKGISCIRVPSQIILVRKGPAMFPIRKKTEFDFCAGIDGVSAFFDAKMEEAKEYFNFKARILEPKKIHQWNALRSCYENGNVAGYLLWFPTQNKIGWASVPVIANLIAQGIKSIIETSEGVVWQSDQIPIDLRVLMAKDISLVKSRLSPLAK